MGGANPLFRKEGKEMKKFKKLLCMVLAFAMCMSLFGTVSFADDGDDDETTEDTTTEETTEEDEDDETSAADGNGGYTITIENTTNGHTYYLIQLLSGDVVENDDGDMVLVNAEVGSGVGDSSKTVSDVIEAIEEAAYTDSDGDDEWDVDEDGNVVLYEGNLSTGAYDMIDEFELLRNDFVEADSDSVTFSNVESGYYIIYEEGEYSTESYEYDSSSNNEESDSAELIDDGEYNTLTRTIVSLVYSDDSIGLKNTSVSVDKIITGGSGENDPIEDSDEKVNTAAIGDTVDYEITADLPDTTGFKEYYYIIEDTLSGGLTLDEGSFKIKIVSGVFENGSSDATFLVFEYEDDEYVCVSEGDYENKKASEIYDDVKDEYDCFVYLDEGNEGVSTTFRIAFLDILNKTYAKTSGESVIVTYSAVLNEDAAVGVTANTNNVQLTYSTNPNYSSDGSEGNDNPPGVPGSSYPTGTTPKIWTYTYTTSVSVVKIDADTEEKLTGAAFELTGENLNTILIETGTAYVLDDNGTYYKLTDGTYTETKPGTTDEDGNVIDESKYESTTDKYKKVNILEASDEETNETEYIGYVDEDGVVTFVGLNAGEYTLSEVVTPTGYSTVDDINFKISTNFEVNEDGDYGTGYTFSWTLALDSSDATYYTLSGGEKNDDEISVTGGTFEIIVSNPPGFKLPETGAIGKLVLYSLGAALVLGAGSVLIRKKRKNAA